MKYNDPRASYYTHFLRIFYNCSSLLYTIRSFKLFAPLFIANALLILFVCYPVAKANQKVCSISV